MNNISTDILFEKFEVIECFKKDNYSGVYAAKHIYLGKKIILKTLNTKNLPDKTILERFKREAKILAKLDHPNLIKVLDFGTYKNYFYLSFEYFESENLREIISKNFLDENEKIDLVIQLLKALNAAHQNNIIHRDIKPENILVDAQNKLKIADFGLALVLNDINITQKSSIVGTPSYMSPEQIRGEKLNQQTDLFSAGIVCYELFSGKNPFLGEDLSLTINKILNFNENEISEQLALFPEKIQPVMFNMLRKSIKNRADSAKQLLSMLGVEATEYNLVVKNFSRYNLKKTLIYTLVPLVFLILAFFIWLSEFNPTKDAFKSVSDNIFKNRKETKQVEPIGNQQKIPTGAGIEKPAESLSLNNPDKNNGITAVKKPGTLFVEALPWAEVSIDDIMVDTTPLKKSIQLSPGYHTIKLSHPDYPSYQRRINITSAKQNTIKIDFNDVVGYLKCNIYPWGEIYIDGVYKAQTPLRRAIILAPGKHTLTIKNPQYPVHEEKIILAAKKTLTISYNFEAPKSK